MKKYIITIVVVTTVSFLTAFSILKVLNGIIEDKVEDTIFKKSIKIKDSSENEIPKSNKIDKPRIDSTNTIISNREIEIEISKFVILASDYCNRKEKKSQDILTYYRTKLKNYYAIKGLNNELNSLLLATISKLNIELEKLKKQPNKNLQKDTTGVITNSNN